MITLTNELNDENIERIKQVSDICDGTCYLTNCDKCVKSYLKNLLDNIGQSRSITHHLESNDS